MIVENFQITNIEYFVLFLLQLGTLLGSDVCHVVLMDFEVTNRAFLVVLPLVKPEVSVKVVHVVGVYQATNDVGKLRDL